MRTTFVFNYHGFPSVGQAAKLAQILGITPRQALTCLKQNKIPPTSTSTLARRIADTLGSTTIGQWNYYGEHDERNNWGYIYSS